jgi:hypothetical protein
MCAPERMSIRGGLLKSADTRRPRLVSRERKRRRRRLQPASCETGASYNQGRRATASLRATNVGNVAAALHAADLASAKTGPAADATDDLRLAAGCRPSGGAVDSPPQAVASRMCASGSQDERGLASASVEAAALGVYVLPAPSASLVSFCVSQRRLSQRVDAWWGLRALSSAVEAVGSRGGAVFRDCV